MQEKVAALASVGEADAGLTGHGAVEGGAGATRQQVSSDASAREGSPIPPAGCAAGDADADAEGEQGAPTRSSPPDDAEAEDLGARLREIRGKVAVSTPSPVTKQKLAQQQISKTDGALRKLRNRLADLAEEVVTARDDALLAKEVVAGKCTRRARARQRV